MANAYCCYKRGFEKKYALPGLFTLILVFNSFT